MWVAKINRECRHSRFATARTTLKASAIKASALRATAFVQRGADDLLHATWH
jgi:hypothetical protein